MEEHVSGCFFLNTVYSRPARQALFRLMQQWRHASRIQIWLIMPTISVLHISNIFITCVFLGFKFSRASYVLSLLRPKVMNDLELKVQRTAGPYKRGLIGLIGFLSQEWSPTGNREKIFAPPIFPSVHNVTQYRNVSELSTYVIEFHSVMLFIEITLTHLFLWHVRLCSTRQALFTARCTIVQSSVLRSHVVCLSVRLPVRLWRWWIVIT